MSTPDSNPAQARVRALKTLTTETYDLAIVGGGITGAGIARDAALRGLKVALIEKHDFGAGTSSKSSKLVHGGLRYLEQAELKLVFESVSERNRLMKLARHLVRPLPFLVPSYKGDRRWLMTLDLGLWIYDALCLFRSFQNHRTFGPVTTQQLEPALRKTGLKGGILYYDCLTDDARLTLENVLDAQTLGANVLNHVRAGKLLRENDKVIGLEVTDELTQQTLEVRAKLVVNATGPWSDEVREMAGEPRILKPTKGIHLVLEEKRLPVKHAMMMLNPKDGRVVFAIPWGLGRTVVGTTDTFFEGRADDCHADAEDVAYLLQTANYYCPDSQLTERDVIATWAGLRPLLKPHSEGTGASQVSREHQIYERPGFITIAGGKLTTYRLIALEVVDHALKQLGVHKESATAHRPLPGTQGLESDDDLARLCSELEKKGLPKDLSSFWGNAFGARSSKLSERALADASTQARLDEDLPYTLAQADLAVEEELAATLDDVLSRRLPLLLRGRDQGLNVAEQIAARMAQKLGWSDAQKEAQLADYRRVVGNSRQFRSPAERVRRAG
ncbi:MAG: glycerol-3-phosphate dehydrogenase/oxidase [Myxococcaceae bacterium]